MRVWPSRVHKGLLGHPNLATSFHFLALSTAIEVRQRLALSLTHRRGLLLSCREGSRRLLGVLGWDIDSQRRELRMNISKASLLCKPYIALLDGLLRHLDFREQSTLSPLCSSCL